ncbi:MAG TPA: hypothetical protein VFR15_13745 [Chloroflexia bacterium]|nr:hypothetical protein [Chloroflexia bacterium]
MNIKLKRVVRTPQSEEIAIFDTDTRDANEAAVNIGKLEVHYLEDQVVGTLLLWQEFTKGFAVNYPPGSDITMDDVIDQILSEVTEPLGVAGEYGIEVYYPTVSNQGFVSNYAAADDTGGSELDEYAESEGAEYEEEEELVEGEPRDDEFYRRLRERT